MRVEDVPGYVSGDLLGLYQEAVLRAPTHRKSIFVEVGIAFGRSTFYMADLIKQSGKPIAFHAADPHDWSHEGRLKFAREAGGDQEVLDLVAKYKGYPMCNIVIEIRKKLDLEGYVSLNTMRGHELSALLNRCERKPIDFLYVDASHEETDTREILQAFLPLMRSGGIVAGHDLDHPSYPGVRRAVETVFGSDWEKVGCSFKHEVK